MVRAERATRRRAPGGSFIWPNTIATLSSTWAFLPAESMYSASDISRRALAQARQARYTRWSLRNGTAAQPYLRQRGDSQVLDDRIRRLVTFEYLNLFDVTNIQPSPSEETANRDVIVWSFDPPPGDVFSVTFDAATEVGAHVLPPATASVLVDGRPAAQVRFRTVVVP